MRWPASTVCSVARLSISRSLQVSASPHPSSALRRQSMPANESVQLDAKVASAALSARARHETTRQARIGVTRRRPVRKRRLFFVNRFFHPDHSATSQMLSDLAFALSRDGEDVVVIASRQLYEHPEARLPARDVIKGVAVHRASTTQFGRARLVGRALDYLSFHLTA